MGVMGKIDASVKEKGRWGQWGSWGKLMLLSKKRRGGAVGVMG